MQATIEMKWRSRLFLGVVVIVFLMVGCVQLQRGNGDRRATELNMAEIEKGKKVTAIVGARIIVGKAGVVIEDGTVVVTENKIEVVGDRAAVKVPESAEVVDGKGMTVLPGLIDAHFHLDNMAGLPALFLQHGVTSIRDPGAWNHVYDAERKSGQMIPRLFLCGPHIDMYPPAYPHDAFVARDKTEAVQQVNRAADEGASAIKVYFRMPPDMIRAVCEAAHARGLPVTAHLEITEARLAISQGLDGVEHITSFGQSLVVQKTGEQYRQLILADNNARKQGRYDLWKEVDPENELTDSLCRFLVQKGTFVTPTLGPFEYRLSGEKTDTVQMEGFVHMQQVTRKMSEAGVNVVVGSHSSIPYAETGWAYQHEMELWAEAGINNALIIEAATIRNARFFKIDERLGSVEKGKQADLLLVHGNPLDDIKQMRQVAKVMLNGAWVQGQP